MGTTRGDLHRISAHVLGRRRYQVSGHFGLRASPGGLGTPAYGSEPEALRLTATTLVREVGTDARCMPLGGASLAELAAFAGADLTADFSAGPDTPPLGAVEEPLHLVTDELSDLYAWFDLGSRVLDAVVPEPPGVVDRSTVQLWPEHFDVGAGLGLGGGRGVNLGFSPGDGYSDEPYLYVGPWGSERPGDPAYWNAPFGASVTRTRAPDTAACLAFIARGLRALRTPVGA